MVKLSPIGKIAKSSLVRINEFHIHCQRCIARNVDILCAFNKTWIPAVTAVGNELE
jgi:hypothetical protein